MCENSTVKSSSKRYCNFPDGHREKQSGINTKGRKPVCIYFFDLNYPKKMYRRFNHQSFKKKSYNRFNGQQNRGTKRIKSFNPIDLINSFQTNQIEEEQEYIVSPGT